MFTASVVTFILFMLCFGSSPNPSLHLYFCPFHCCDLGVFVILVYEFYMDAHHYLLDFLPRAAACNTKIYLF